MKYYLLYRKLMKNYQASLQVSSAIHTLPFIASIFIGGNHPVFAVVPSKEIITRKSTLSKSIA